MAETKTFDPAAAGFRVASTPIKRKQRRPSSKKVPRPQYADAVWYSFEHNHPLEAVVPVRAVEDTIRKLKQAARFLERTEGAEVRVQIGVEAAPDADGKKQSVVKFLGHEPWLLGRRVAKVEADAREAGPEAAQDIMAARDEPAPAVPAPRQPPGHRRTVAGTRPSKSRRRASLRRALVGSVITRLQPPYPGLTVMRGLWCLR